MIEASQQNFDLKTEVFQREIEKTKFENKRQQAERNITLLAEKKKGLDAQIAQAEAAEKEQTRKLESDMSRVENECNKARKEFEDAEAQLSTL